MMGRSTDTYRRLVVLGLQRETVRGGIAALILVLIVLGGGTLVLALFFAVTAYVGMRLIAASIDRPVPRRRLLNRPLTASDMLKDCQELRPQIAILIHSIEEERTAPHLRRISSQLDQIIAAIWEDEQFDATPSLLNLMNTTADLLTPYAKAMRRGLGSDGVMESFERDLSTLEAALDLLWTRVNRETIVNLEAVSELIEFNLNDRQESQRDGGTR